MNISQTIERLLVITSLVAIAFLGLVGGLAIHEFEVWPYQLFKDAYHTYNSLIVRLTPNKSRYKDIGLYKKIRYTQSGIVKYDKERAYNGYTLFTSGHAQKAFLMSMTGEIVHEWYFPFSKLWTNPPHLTDPVPDELIYWRKAYLYPNGDLLAVYCAVGTTPYGYGLAKVDKDSNLLWSYAGRMHHDIDVGSDGKIYALSHEFTSEKIPGAHKLSQRWLEDTIVVLAPDGKELKKVSIAKVFLNSPHFFLAPSFWHGDDPLHANTIDVLDKTIAPQFPFLKAGQVLTSLRTIDTIGVIDLDKEQLVWAMRGPWHMQHDPDFLPNGNMLIFDNQGHLGEGGASQVIEFSPKTGEIIWQYTGDKENIFFSGAKSDQQRLPNGNTLITESYHGRIFEVTPDKQIVWEFITPFRAPHDSQIAANLCWGQRFHPDLLHFEFSNPNRD